MNIKLNKLKIALLIAGSTVLMANRGGTPGGRTGSSTDGSTCATNGGCHGNAASTSTHQDFITSNIPETGYEIGKTYSITVSPKKDGVSVWGFEMMAEGADGDGTGTFISNSEVNALNDGIRASHKFASSSSDDGQTWTVEWTAPETTSGEVSFFAASLAANGTGNTNGDNVFFDTLVVASNALTHNDELHIEDAFVYPNPAVDVLNVSGVNLQGGIMEIVDMRGKIVLRQPFTNSIGLSDIESGNYCLNIYSDTKTITKKFVVK
jgi:hypothetical protein